MDERRLTKEIYEVVLGGNAVRGRPWRTFLDQIGQVFEKGQVRRTRNRRACMRNLMKVEEAVDGRWTLYLSYFKGISANIDLQVYNVTYC
jgi:hypothetical protein